MHIVRRAVDLLIYDVILFLILLLFYLTFFPCLFFFSEKLAIHLPL